MYDFASLFMLGGSLFGGSLPPAAIVILPLTSDDHTYLLLSLSLLFIVDYFKNLY